MRHAIGATVIAGVCAFGWFAPASWLIATQWVLPPLAFGFAAFVAFWAWRLRTDDDPGRGNPDVEIVLPPDPGGLSVDWDAELASLTRKATL